MASRWRKNGQEMAVKMAEKWPAISKNGQPFNGKMAKKWLLKIFKMEWQKRWHFAIPFAIRWIEMAWISNSD